jgi:hypothetical protein
MHFRKLLRPPAALAGLVLAVGFAFAPAAQAAPSPVPQVPSPGFSTYENEIDHPVFIGAPDICGGCTVTETAGGRKFTFVSAGDGVTDDFKLRFNANTLYCMAVNSNNVYLLVIHTCDGDYTIWRWEPALQGGHKWESLRAFQAYGRNVCATGDGNADGNALFLSPCGVPQGPQRFFSDQNGSG